MKKNILLVVLISNFWAVQVQADMDRVSTPYLSYNSTQKIILIQNVYWI